MRSRLATSLLTLALGTLLTAPARAELSPPLSSHPEWTQLAAPGAFTPSDRPRYQREDFPLRLYYVGEPPEGLRQDEIELAARHAAQAWSEVPCAFAALRYEGRVHDLSEVPDGAIAITHVPQASTPCLRLGDQGLIGAAPCPLDEGRLRGAVFNRDQMRWYSLATRGAVQRWDAQSGEPPSIDFTASLTHELGHILGLSHPPSSDPPLATMYASYAVDGGQATLAADDRAGLCELYPVESARQSCQQDGDCASALDDPGASCVTISGWQVCEQELGRQGDYCSDDTLLCPALCLITSDASRTGYCTMRCTTSEACGEGWACDEDAVTGADGPIGVCRPEAVVLGTTPDQEAEGCQSSGGRTPAGWPLWGALLALLFGVRLRSRR